MLAWLSANLATILICAALLVVVGLILRSMIRSRKQGKSSCGCDGCGECPMSGDCHPKK
ncbi:MAG: FeoB-associated Cys-rich membrane protein [Candidatus Limiplasma sp.]|nr:FeoB-associated Cys-rich membrane protein [Candidatus Limiplasma sp.]